MYVILLPKLNTSKSIRVTNFSKLYAVKFVCAKINDIELTQVICTLVSSHTRACSTYDQFLVRGSLLTNKLMSQGFQQSRLQATFRKVYGRYVQRSHLPMQPLFFWGGDMLSDMFHTNRKAILDTLILAMVRTDYLIWK
jgi:hypothetical protein